MDNESQQTKEQKKEVPLNELLKGPLVNIKVGPESTEWSIHERLITHHSPFFASEFEGKENTSENQSQGPKSYTLSDEDDAVFEKLVSWLYSRHLTSPKSEEDTGPLLELYLLAEKLQIPKLSSEVVEVVREWYHTSETYPGLRRVQYIYAETEEDNEMREMMVSSVARQMATSDKIPAYWAKALQRNGQLAVDIIRSIQHWNLEGRSIPDARDVSQGRGRVGKGGGFSAVERDAGDSVETTGTADTNLGVESLNSAGSDDARANDEDPPTEIPPTPILKDITSSSFSTTEDNSFENKIVSRIEPDERPPPTPPRPIQQHNRPPDKLKNENESERERENENEGTQSNYNEKDESSSSTRRQRLEGMKNTIKSSSWPSTPQSIFLLIAWMAYLTYSFLPYSVDH